MRAWYHSTEGLSANLCQLLYSESTRLIVLKDGKHLEYTVYPSWDDAFSFIRVLKPFSARFCFSLLFMFCFPRHHSAVSARSARVYRGEAIPQSENVLLRLTASRKEPLLQATFCPA